MQAETANPRDLRFLRAGSRRHIVAGNPRIVGLLRIEADTLSPKRLAHYRVKSSSYTIYHCHRESGKVSTKLD